MYNQKTLFEDLKDKMFYELQKAFVIKLYKATNLHKFVKMYKYIDQTLRNMNNKSRRKDFVNDVERKEIIIIINSNKINQNHDKSNSRSRFEISKLNFRTIIESSKN